MEGITPIIYGATVAMAYYGPNANILAGIRSSFWGEKIEDIGNLYSLLFILFAFDTISVVVTSICIWKAANVNMIREISRVLGD